MTVFIIAADSIMADTMQALGHQGHCLASVGDPEILTVAVVAARYFQNHQERALCMMVQAGYLPTLSVSRYKRRLHALMAWLEGLLGILCELFAQGGGVHYRQLTRTGVQTGSRQTLQESQG